LLSEIRIKKFLYLKDIEISLSDRLNVFTGETGVGKSLIIDAISFVLGERGNFEENDYVELMFETDNQYAEDGILILARQVKNGKNIYYLNGRKVVKSIVDEISQNLIEIHGQHASQKLFDADYQREIFDKFAKVEDKLVEFQKLYSEYIKVKKEYEDILSKQAENQRKIDFLTFQINELSSANIKPGEKHKLEEEYKYLSNIALIKEVAELSKNVLSVQDGSVLSNLSLVIKNISKISDLSESLSKVLQNLEEAKALIEDAFYKLEDTDFYADDYKLREIEERLNLINNLERKYHVEADEMSNFLEGLNGELSTLMNLEDKLPELEERLKTLENKINQLADEISSIRKSKVNEFEDLVVEGLKDLAFKTPIFKVKIEEKPIDKYGKDKITFYFSANLGFEPRPLSEVASGGEISRISLILKLISKKSVKTLIFDEIDTGIGGKTAIEMAKKLKELSKDFQVVLITHLPQIAVVGDRHFYISKEIEDDKTVAKVSLLEEDRGHEIARMLTGMIDENSLSLAKQLLKEGEKWTR